MGSHATGSGHPRLEADYTVLVGGGAPHLVANPHDIPWTHQELHRKSGWASLGWRQMHSSVQTELARNPSSEPVCAAQNGWWRASSLGPAAPEHPLSHVRGTLGEGSVASGNSSWQGECGGDISVQQKELLSAVIYTWLVLLPPPVPTIACSGGADLKISITRYWWNK